MKIIKVLQLSKLHWQGTPVSSGFTKAYCLGFCKINFPKLFF